MNTDFLGKGFTYPLQLDALGRIKESKHAQQIKESIQIILGTQHGERLMRPNFGCNLKSLVFAPNNTATANLARFYVEEGLKTWEPRIQLEAVVIRNENTPARLLIDIRYRIKSSNEPGNLVHTFYLEQA